VDLDGSQANNSPAGQPLQRAACSVLRDTDSAGWYKTGKTLGLIFTCLAEPTKMVARDVIDARLDRTLFNGTAESARNMRVTYHFFPETNGSGPRDPALYPDHGDNQANPMGRVVKRVMDVSGSLLALALLWPLFLLIWAAIKSTSRGPALFRQQRVGQDERPFTFLKFRSMYENNDPEMHREYVTRFIAGNQEMNVGNGDARIYKMMNDPRVTPIGRLLRRSSLDELPQFLNVFRGDMSLVGPRPAVPYEHARYNAWHRQRVMTVKPGITGLWQVNGRSRTTFDEMVRFDLDYVRNWSIWLDLKILLRTPVVVLSCEGAY
jgi:exopolysaccharide biosynthesis polyprenyl glycosylphosphotransferase